MTYSIYHREREYAREMGDPLLAQVEAPSKEAAESMTAHMGLTGTLAVPALAEARPHGQTSFRLRAGDLVRYAGQTCRVLRVSESAAVLAIAQPARVFTTLEGITVRLQPKPALVCISPNSELPILNR